MKMFIGGFALGALILLFSASDVDSAFDFIGLTYSIGLVGSLSGAMFWGFFG